MQQHPHCIACDPHLFRNLRVLPALQGVQAKHLRLPLRQSSQGHSQSLRQFPRHGILKWLGLAAPHKIKIRQLLSRVAPSPLPQSIDRPRGGQSMQQRSPAFHRLPFRERERGQECLLENLIRICSIPQQPVGRSPHPLPLLANDGFPGNHGFSSTFDLLPPGAAGLRGLLIEHRLHHTSRRPQPAKLTRKTLLPSLQCSTMTLRRKMALQIGAMVLAIGLLAGASIWGLLGLQRDLGSALTGYEELRQVFEVGSHIRTAQTLLSLEQPDCHQAMREIQYATDILALSQHHIRHKDELSASLREAQQQLWPAIVDNQSAANANALLDKPLRQLSNLTADVRQRIKEKEDAAARKRHTTLVLMSLISGLTVAGAIIVGFLHYRSVAAPLKKLQASVRILAEGKLSQRVPLLGPAEFASLASDFNRMATELDTLYRQLEEKVAAKSKELVRSERLASVGYLAAGVAHEINNPMGIIAGYAEFSLQALKQKSPPEALAEAEKSMKVIAEEAFRCKQITQKLLSLARQSDDNRSV